MSTNLEKGDKKNALTTYKNKLLNEIYYYEKRIEEARNNRQQESSFQYDSSSDSDSELSQPDLGPSLPQLKIQHDMLKICLHATQELTNLEVLQSEVNVLFEEPKFEGEPPVMEPGIWREVTAECCVDLVPFTITFYAHCADKKFASIKYRGLRVTPLKASHKAELEKSVLATLRHPSDAVEASGGYQLKCANTLEVSWMLQNKWSPVAPFHHRLKFDIEYMEGSYIKTITQAHRQLSDPAVDTDERTLLLAKIISTCLAALPLELEGPEPCSPEGRPRRTTLDREPDEPNMKTNKDSEVMAPPKSLPKKVKPKTKSPLENKTSDPKLKRSMQDDSNNITKKQRMNENIQSESKIGGKDIPNTGNVKTAVNNESNTLGNANVKNKDERIVITIPDSRVIDEGTKINNPNEPSGKKQNLESTKKGGKASNKKQTELENNKNLENKKISNKKTTESENNKNLGNINKSAVQAVANVNDEFVPMRITILKRKSMTNINKEKEHKKKSRNSVPSNKKKVVVDKNNFDNSKGKVRKVKSDNVTENTKTIEKRVSKDGSAIKKLKNITNEKGEVARKVIKKVTNNIPKETEKISVIKDSKTVIKKSDDTMTAEKIKKFWNEEADKINKTPIQKTEKKAVKPSSKISKFAANKNVKKVLTATIEKENLVQNKTSKIPKKRIESPKKVIKKMTVRVSPRNKIVKPKPALAGVNPKKIVQKSVTAIPRLLTKPKPKVKSP